MRQVDEQRISGRAPHLLDGLGAAGRDSSGVLDVVRAVLGYQDGRGGQIDADAQHEHRQNRYVGRIRSFGQRAACAATATVAVPAAPEFFHLPGSAHDRTLCPEFTGGARTPVSACHRPRRRRCCPPDRRRSSGPSGIGLVRHRCRRIPPVSCPRGLRHTPCSLRRR